MQLEKETVLEKAAVLGAAGKMGRGISCLLVQQIACGIAKKDKDINISHFKLALIDADEAGFISLKRYLEEQLRKYAEKNINEVRRWYAHRDDMVENREIIDSFCKTAMDCVRFGTSLEEARGCNLIFEAIVEDVEVKSDIFRKLNEILGPHAYYFTNTSSIPIETLQDKSKLHGRLIGFHFYNPPAVQRLVEVVVPKEIDPHLKVQVVSIAKQLKKTVVFSNDVAGFIGNGHLIREVYFACQKVRSLSKTLPLDISILLINCLTQECLLRPMGIFQLVDYIGIDIVSRIAKIMTQYLKGESFLDSFIEDMVKNGLLGGQRGDGTQKEGFFQYKNSNLDSIYDLTTKSYVPLTDERYAEVSDQIVGARPEANISWKSLSKSPERLDKMQSYFQELFLKLEPAPVLSKEFLTESRRIAYHLVDTGVANSIHDVDAVLRNGFFHLYDVDFPFAFKRLTLKG